MPYSMGSLILTTVSISIMRLSEVSGLGRAHRVKNGSPCALKQMWDVRMAIIQASWDAVLQAQLRQRVGPDTELCKVPASRDPLWMLCGPSVSSSWATLSQKDSSSNRNGARGQLSRTSAGRRAQSVSTAAYQQSITANLISRNFAMYGVLLPTRNSVSTVGGAQYQVHTLFDVHNGPVQRRQARTQSLWAKILRQREALSLLLQIGCALYNRFPIFWPHTSPGYSVLRRTPAPLSSSVNLLTIPPSAAQIFGTRLLARSLDTPIGRQNFFTFHARGRCLVMSRAWLLRLPENTK
ncbi:hypothetical protein C8R45DRAFT_935165 [Mycena sanguinolenta]|nr:hypothetical protein C8R45DRAFT_935165 [Mycena sanguinolenta]